MDFKKFIRDNIEIEVKIHEMIIEYIDDETDDDHNYELLKQYLQENKIPIDKYELKNILHIISKISNNHHQNQNFYFKVKKLINFFKKDIIHYLSNFQIFNIFKNNKRIILYLIEEKMIIPDLNIFNIIKQHKYYGNYYPQYFYPEFKSFFSESFISQMKNKNPEVFTENPQIFESKRQIGENDNYICQLIRNDSIVEFISYVNRYSISLTSSIKKSIFETNPFLLKAESISLFEYTAFYGSIQIYQYLRLNNVKLSPSLWIYSIHSQNAELIHMLEEDQVELSDSSYIQCYKETIKCHHIDFMNYFYNNFLIDEKKYDEYLDYSLKYYNFINMSNLITDEENQKKERTYFDFILEYYYKSNLYLILKSLILFICGIFNGDNKMEKPVEDENLTLHNNLCKYDYFNFVNFLLTNMDDIDINNDKINIWSFLFF